MSLVSTRNPVPKEVWSLLVSGISHLSPEAEELDLKFVELLLPHFREKESEEAELLYDQYCQYSHDLQEGAARDMLEHGRRLIENPSTDRLLQAIAHLVVQDRSDGFALAAYCLSDDEVLEFLLAEVHNLPRNRSSNRNATRWILEGNDARAAILGGRTLSKLERDHLAPSEKFLTALESEIRNGSCYHLTDLYAAYRACHAQTLSPEVEEVVYRLVRDNLSVTAAIEAAQLI